MPTAHLPVGYGLAAAADADEPEFREEVDSLPCEASLAASRPMKAKGSLYWTLDDGSPMLVFDAAPEAMKLSMLDLPPIPPRTTFDVIDTGDESDGLRLLTMRDFCLETWVAAAAPDGSGETTWMLKEKLVRFYWALQSKFGALNPRRFGSAEIIGVVDGFVFLRQFGKSSPRAALRKDLQATAEHRSAPVERRRRKHSRRRSLPSMSTAAGDVSGLE
ncbi:hypothetical protein ABZP36_029630 [Zizania latifolia]